jgi:hypothetical protein
MTTPFLQRAFEGLVGASTASFYRLNKFGVPTQLITDIDPIPTPDRATLDMIDSESNSEDYAVTENPLQDLSSATTNVHRELERVEITGTLTSSINLGLLGSVGIGNLPGQPSLLRADLLVLNNLRALARRREAIMYVSPRKSLPFAFIQRIVDNWTPELGENTTVQISLVEARIVSPLTANSLLTQAVKQPAAPGAAPFVVAT